MLERIFEPFSTTKPSDVGTGLGLSIVYGLVTRHDGTVHVQSRPGAGTTFEVRLPLAREQDELAGEPAPAPPQRGEGPLCILLVEDERAVRQFVRDVLERDGHDVEPATNGLEALAAFQRRGGEIDLVITDLVLPFLSGEELFELFTKERRGLCFSSRPGTGCTASAAPASSSSCRSPSARASYASASPPSRASVRAPSRPGSARRGTARRPRPDRRSRPRSP